MGQGETPSYSLLEVNTLNKFQGLLLSPRDRHLPQQLSSAQLMAEPLFGRVNPSPPTAEGLQTARCEHPAEGRKEGNSPNGEWDGDVFWSGIALSVLPLLCSHVYLHLSFFSSAVAMGHMHFDKVQGSIHFQCEPSQSRSDYEKVCLNSNTWAWLTSSPQGASKSKSHVPAFLHRKAKRNDHEWAGIKKNV